jgi:hypothetical protein
MEQAIDVLEKRKNIDILLCGGTKQRGDKIWNVYVPPGKNFGRKVQDLFNYSSNWVGMLARRSSLAQIGLVDTSVFAYDTEFLCRSIYLGLTVRFCRLNAYHHVLYDHSGTIAQEERFYSDQEEIKKKYLEAPQNITGSKQKLKQLIRFIIPGVFIPYLRRIYNYLRRVNITQVQESTNNNEPVWDGGIS